MSLQLGEIKAISDYTKLNFAEVESLAYSEYALYRKESFIYVHSQTEEGQDFLKDLERFNTKTADENKIRKMIGGDKG